MRWLGAVGIAAVTVFASLLYLFAYQRWEDAHTRGMAYYGKKLAARRSLKRRIFWFSLPARFLLRLLALPTRSRLTMPGFVYGSVAGPLKVSSPEVFRRAQGYQPQPEDVFIATQMRCGTTWMQQLVYEVVNRGEGDLSDEGDGHLYAISPWIDAVDSVSIEAAPVVGERRTRIIKTHLPASLCPYSPKAKYIYVVRHPVSCFASIVDFNRSMLGPLLPPIDTLAEWFCSDRMYWLPWPQHVDGWWRLSQSHDNILFVHFEEMKRDLGAVVDRVAILLGCALSNAERRRVAEKCSFRYMKEHEEVFEMAPPTMFSVAGGRFLASGKESRHEDVTPKIRDYITDYCRRALNESVYPVKRYYPEIDGPPRHGAVSA